MLFPNFQKLAAIGGNVAPILSVAQPMHPNPEYFKYRWWIFHKNSPCEGREFLVEENLLSTAEAMALRARLSEEKEPHWIFNRSYPRLPSPGGSIWDVNGKRWEEYDWAPSLANDKDAEWKGHK
jgi:hypothetical protein